MNTPMRPELEPLPERMKHLPVDKRGFPVPWFVAWPDGPTGEPEFRAMDFAKWVAALKQKLCWCCGQPMGVWKTFVIGPMCGVNRVNSEPPSHLDCARWSARNCPILTLRQVKRREDEECPYHSVGGVAIKRNPGVALLWTTREFTVFNDGAGGRLLRIGEPAHVEWYAHGRHATRAEVIHSVETGLPILMEMAVAQSPEAVAELGRMKQNLERLYPAI